MAYKEEGDKRLIKIDLQFFADEKTEEPTQKHRQEARKKGQVARSHEVMVAVSFFCTVIFFTSMLPGVARKLFGFFQGIFINQVGSLNHGGELVVFTMDAIKYFIILILPLIIVPFIAVLLSGIAQGGLLFTGDTLAPKLERINPVKGLQRIISKRAFVEFVKALLKISIIGAIVYSAMKKDLPALIGLFMVPLREAISIVADILKSMGFKVGGALILIALIDYWYQRYEYEMTLKMTKDEVKEEYKQMEGDPLVKQRIREAQRRIANQRMMNDVPTADVIITNPTHVAVALKYETKKMNAPKVVAKGKGYIAERIKELAKENKVTIVENKPIAWSLYEEVEIGEEIPAELYKAVAEILAYVYRLKGQKM